MMDYRDTNGDNETNELFAWAFGVLTGIMVAWAFLMATGCNAQDTRWRLIQPTQRDSIVAVPLKDLRVAAGYRIAKNVSQRQCAWELVERAKELESARQTIEEKNAALFKKDEAIDGLRKNGDSLLGRAQKAEQNLRGERVSAIPYIGLGFGLAMTITQPSSPLGPYTMAASGAAIITIRLF